LIAATDYIARTSGIDRFDLALVLGSGLGALADEVSGGAVIPFADIPGFPASGVSAHAGAVHAGQLAGKKVLLLAGRVHYYEGGNAAAMAVPVETCAALGCKSLILTNAAGSLREEVEPGRICLVTDHINFSGTNPLIGVEGDGRFVDMSAAYDSALQARARAAAKSIGLDLASGVYIWFSGPCFETPAEIRAARLLGADLVGMSTVPEVILARYHGLDVAAFSMVTNLAAGMRGTALSHAQTKHEAGRAAGDMVALIRAFMREIPDA
jgi:purine-nucleoside phosphorylase